jgi:hypothetical protein
VEWAEFLVVGDDSPYTFLGVQDVKNELTNKLTHSPYQNTPQA